MNDKPLPAAQAVTGKDAMFEQGQKVRLVCEVQDCETGYGFPAGSEGEVELDLGNGYYSISLDKSLGDPLDSGWTPVMVEADALATVSE